MSNEKTGTGKNLKNAHLARKVQGGITGNYTADESKLMTWAAQRGSGAGAFKLNAGDSEEGEDGEEGESHAGALFVAKGSFRTSTGKAKKAYAVTAARRARNAVRKLVRQGLVTPLGAGSYQWNG